MARASTPRASTLMVQGTASSVGKSLIAAALCRHFARLGVRVAPFKAQNMSNNAAVTPEGGEIGRAQALQARACGIPPHVDMNPVLLKPETDHRSQVVVLGRAQGHLPAASYVEGKAALWPAVEAALDRMRAAYELVIIEGAGSPAEINLKAADIVNMRVARHAGSPVLLVGDIDRGGVFASLLGTLELLEPEERALVRGLVINRFRGELSLLLPGLELLRERTGVPVLGVVPYLTDLRLPEEDAVALERPPDRATAAEGAALDVAVVRFPRIANFDDLDPLAAEPGVSVRYVATAEALGEPDLIVLPGTKATLSDLAWLRSAGLAAAIVAAAGRGPSTSLRTGPSTSLRTGPSTSLRTGPSISLRAGSAVIGLCGGYQMLGDAVRDPAGLEGAAGAVEGLGLLPTATELGPEKATALAAGVVRVARGILAEALGCEARGYEIHLGRTGGTAERPFEMEGRDRASAGEGALSADGWVLGTYLHGLFHNDALRRAMLRAVARRRGRAWREPSLRAEALIDAELGRLTDTVEASLDMAAIHALAGVPQPIRSATR